MFSLISIGIMNPNDENIPPQADDGFSKIQRLQLAVGLVDSCVASQSEAADMCGVSQSDISQSL